MLPEWLELARDIERDEQSLAAVRERFTALAGLAGKTDAWAEGVRDLRLLVDEFASRARRLRRKQDRFNLMAPGPATQRPAIWVEQKLRQLAEIVRECGAPEWAVERACA